MVIVHVGIEINAVLGNAVFFVGFETDTRFENSGRFGIDRKPERIRIAFGCDLTASVAVIENSLKGCNVSSVVAHVPRQRIDFEHDMGTDIGSARGIRFPYVFFNVVVNDFARHSVGNGHFHLLCRTQKPRIERVQLIDRSLAFHIITGKRRMILGGKNVGIIARHIIQITAQRDHVFIIVIQAVRTRRCAACLDFVFLFNRFVRFACFDFINRIIEERRFQPVSVERKIGNPEFHAFAVACRKTDKPFEVHPVFKRFIEIVARGFFQRDRNADFQFAVCGNGYGIDFLSVDAIDDRTAVVQHIRFFGNRLFVGGKRFRHNVRFGTVSQRFVGNTVDLETEFVYALLFGIVAEFDFGFGIPRAVVAEIIIFRREIGFGFDRVADACKSCALFPRRVRIALFVARHGRRTHEKLVDAVVEFLSFKSVFRLHVLAKQRRCARHIGRRHARTALHFVSPGDAACDLPAVRGNFGFQF